MKKTLKYGFYLLVIINIHLSCRKKGVEEEISSTVNLPSEKIAIVKTFIVKEEPFQREIIANGTLKAANKANLSFSSQGIIRTINIKEGQKILKGQLIATLAAEERKLKVIQSRINYDKSKLDYEDQLLRQGFKLQDTIKLDNEIKYVAKLRSGASIADINYKESVSELEKGSLIAPFSGKVANLQAQPYNNTSSYDFICTLIDDSEFFVEFKVLEQELSFIKVGYNVNVSPFSSSNITYSGKIESINPFVNDGGMISIKARLKNSGNLFDGMGVRIVVKRPTINSLTVPKEAVLDRQGKKVIFTYVDGKAKWNYVEIDFENNTHYAIRQGLKSGYEVIYQGNFDLSHNQNIQRSPQ